MPNFIKIGAQGLAGNMVKCTPRVLFLYFLQEISWEALRKKYSTISSAWWLKMFYSR